MNVITTSVFDIFKIGPGPSSSHTLGPMKAACRFRQSCSELSDETLDSATSIEVYLYGSLATTGKGHGTDRSVIAGLLGWVPENADPDAFDVLGKDPKAVYEFRAGKVSLHFTGNDIHFDMSPRDLPHPNTLIFRLKGRDGMLLEKEYYSIGGGFILCKGEPELPRPIPPIPYANMHQLRSQMSRHGIGLVELLWRNETVLSGLDAAQVSAGLNGIIDAMESSVERGIVTETILPGPIGLARKACVLYNRSRKMAESSEKFLILLDAYALAASEENAAGHRVVTAPTSGSSGVIPGVIHFLSKHLGVSRNLLRDGLLVAAAIGGIARHNASISGAEVGCQGEIGVAAAMAAAMIAHIRGCEMAIVENAAEIALEHHLGLTCDPIGGFVQIPCIERNAVGAVQAYNAYLLASAGDPAKQKIDFDAVVGVMLETGRDMSEMYKETAKAGLAACCIRC
ncbi:MAG: L-serine dehydratase [Syntrophus sp. SKADARSKE-3]|nr:L-serine dehydratase [Syntrophus sp. SKADARSKE-3]